MSHGNEACHTYEQCLSLHRIAQMSLIYPQKSLVFPPKKTFFHKIALHFFKFHSSLYGVATIGRFPKFVCIFCKKSLQKVYFLIGKDLSIQKTYQSLPFHIALVAHSATHCNSLQCTALHCNTPQHIATHCNTLQQIIASDWKNTKNNSTTLTNA